MSMKIEGIFDPIERFEDFIKSYRTEDGTYKYRVMLQKMSLTGSKSLVIDFEDLLRFDPELAKKTLENPEEFIESASRAIKNVMLIEDPDYAKKIEKFYPRFKNLPEKISLRKIRSHHIGQLVAIDGIITRASEVKPQLIEAVFECQRCHEKIVVLQEEGKYTPPVQCTNPTCRRKGPFKLIVEESKFIDWQKIRVQERPEDLPPGQLPRFIDAYLKDDLVDIARPGDRVTVIGILKTSPEFGQRGRKTATFRVFIETNYVELTEKEAERLEITPEEEQKILELAKDQWIHKKIIRSIAPSIYGYDDIKEAIALLLFGGVPKTLPDGMRIRGEPNILLVGDPGTAKSQLLRYVARIAPRGIYTSGKGSTAAGLTAAVIRDPETGGMSLEAGALVLSDRGVACLHGDSKVLIDNEIVSIGSLFDEQRSFRALSGGEVVEICELNVNTISMDSSLKTTPSRSLLIRRKKYNGEILEITLASGFKVKVTPDHKLIDGNTLEWKEAKEFKEGDFIVAPLKLPENKEDIYLLDIIPDNWLVILGKEEKMELKRKILATYKSLSEFNRKYNVSKDFLSGKSQIKAGKLRRILKDLGCYEEWRNKCLKYGRKASGEKLKVNKITPELAYFLGFVYGDGGATISRRRSRLSITQSLENKKQIEVLKRMFYNFSQRKLGEYKRKSISLIRGKKVESENVILYVNSNLLAYIYSYIVGEGLKNLLKLPDEALKAFIAGCLDSDGCISIKRGRKSNKIYETVHIEFQLSNNEEENEAFLLALRRFDCFAKLVKDKKINKIIITGREDAIRLLNVIKNYSVKIKSIPAKKHMVSSFSDKLPNVPVAKISDQIISSVNKSVLLERGIWSTLYAYKNKKYQPSRQQLLKIKDRISDLLNKELLHQIELLVSRDYFLDKIVKIKAEKYSGYVYDLYVPKYHNFVCDGIIVHNCIDEFDKMNPQDRVAIHEAMEQQTISIAKAGIVATLNARTAILAAANPKLGRYDHYRPPADNINLPPTILSRFDLIFILTDRPRVEVDKQVAEHILALHQMRTVEPPIPPDLLRKYIAYARKNVNPVLTPEAAKRIEQFYLELRSIGEAPTSPVPITARQLEALIRLAEAHARMALRDRVTVEDAEEAIRLMKLSLQQVGIDSETGQLDIDLIMTGHSKSQRDKMEKILDLIDELSEDVDKAVPVSKLIERANIEGIDEEFVKRAIERMKKEGIIFEPRPGHVKKA